MPRDCGERLGIHRQFFLWYCAGGARGDGKAGKLFLVAGERLEANPECPFGSIWEAVLEEQGIRPMLGTEEWELMCRFGNSIGYLDLEMQQKTLALYLEELERAIEQLRREEPEKKRLCGAWDTRRAVSGSVVDVSGGRKWELI